jgi:hypothetical protein
MNVHLETMMYNSTFEIKFVIFIVFLVIRRLTPPRRRAKNFSASRCAAAAEGKKYRRAAADPNISASGTASTCTVKRE